MKLFRFSTLALLVLFSVVFNSCKEEDKTSLVNFDPTSYNLTAADLQPVIVSLTLDPSASENSSITISFSGADAGTAFTTTPALSGSSVTIPVASGDESASFTLNFNQANLPVGDFVLTMALDDVGAGLNKGIKTKAVINVDNDKTSLVNFNPEAYNATATDLQPVIVSLTLDSPSSNISSIAISFSGADAGTAFTTTPPLSGSTVTIPVPSGGEGASFTVNFNQANLPVGDFVLSMTIDNVGSGLIKGNITEAVINVANDNTSLVNFDPEAYLLAATDLEPVIVSLTLDPPASENSSIAISFSGADAGTVFTTTPALSGSTVTIPITSGDESASYTVNFNQANLPVSDFVLTMTLSNVGSGLLAGTKTEAGINVTYKELTALPYRETFDEACTAEGPFSPPPGWILKDTKVNQAGPDGINTGSWICTRFAVTGGGVIGNAFVGGSDDLSESETWLISPILGTITSGSLLSFEADLRFNDVQEGYEWYDIMASKDYNGVNFETATWTRFEAAYNKLATNDIEADNSETFSEISLSDFEGGSVAIAFVYRSSKSGNAAAMRVGDFMVE